MNMGERLPLASALGEEVVDSAAKVDKSPECSADSSIQTRIKKASMSICES